MIPKERARPLDQADSGTCSLHAVANATVEKLMDSNIDVKLDEIVGGFKQLDFIDVVEGNDVMEFDQAVIRRMTDKNTKKLYDVTLRITECRVKKDLLKKIQSKEVKCVLVYHQREDPHCVFINELKMVNDKIQYGCINSWGEDRDVLVKVDRPNNQVFEVNVTWQQSQSPSKPARWQRTLGWVLERTKFPTQPQLLKLDLSSKISPIDLVIFDMDEGSDEVAPLLDRQAAHPFKRDQDLIEVPPHCTATGLPRRMCSHCRAKENVVKAAMNGVVRAVTGTAVTEGFSSLAAHQGGYNCL